MNKLMTLMMKLHPMMVRLMLAMTLLVGMSAFAQDAGVDLTLSGSDVPLPPDVSIAQLAADPLNIELLARFVLHAVVEHNWGLLASILLAALLAGLRKFVPERTKLGTWLRTKMGIIVMNLLLSLSTSFALVFVGGGAISAAMVIKAITMAVTASGSWSIWKNINEALAEKKAQTAGEAAAVSPTDTLNK